MTVRAASRPSARSVMILVALVAGAGAAEPAADDGWETILDASSFSMWKMAPAEPTDVVLETAGRKEMRRGDGVVHGSWTFADGVLTGEGDTSHLFSPHGDYADFAFRAEVKISDGGNSGMYFRAKFGNGWPDGYEAQVNATMSDPQKTGSLYNIVRIDAAPVGPETWYTQRIDAVGDHIVIRINDAIVVDTHDAQRRVGHVAFQQHHNTSVVQYRQVQLKRLTAPPAAAPADPAPAADPAAPADHAE